jgi:hypothetical protein
MENDCCVKKEPSVEFVLILPSRETQNIKVKTEHNQEIDEDDSKKIICKVCDKTFESLVKLNGHQRIHQEKVKCSICSKIMFPNHVKRHMKTHDSNRKRDSKCKICAKAFYSNDDLTNHLKTHEKSFECEKCYKKFARKHMMKAHELSHIKLNVICVQKRFLTNPIYSLT